MKKGILVFVLLSMCVAHSFAQAPTPVTRMGGNLVADCDWVTAGLQGCEGEDVALRAVSWGSADDDPNDNDLNGFAPIPSQTQRVLCHLNKAVDNMLSAIESMARAKTLHNLDFESDIQDVPSADDATSLALEHALKAEEMLEDIGILGDDDPGIEFLRQVRCD